jgi:hypothetical protein
MDFAGPALLTLLLFFVPLASCAQFASRSNFAGPALFALAFPPFYRRLEIIKSLTAHGLPYFLITER